MLRVILRKVIVVGKENHLDQGDQWAAWEPVVLKQ